MSSSDGFDYYNRQGEQITFGQYLELMSDAQTRADYKRVGDDEVDGVRVSTVFLGMDHNWSQAGPPILFETMLFGTPDEDNPMVRYSTEQQAREGHEAIVAALRDGSLPDWEQIGGDPS